MEKGSPLRISCTMTTHFGACVGIVAAEGYNGPENYSGSPRENKNET